MVSRCFTVVFLLLCTNSALAAEVVEGDLRDAQKAIYIMKNMGIGNKNFHDAAIYLDRHIDDGYLEINKGEFQGVKMNLRYDVGSTPHLENLELVMKLNDDDPYQIKARPDAILFEYGVTW